MATKKQIPAKGSKRTKRFDEGGYTGDDPIVKYRMGKLSEADTYDALGQKDLANASRAKEPKAAPIVDKQDYGYQYRNNDNFYNTSSPEDIANASFAKAQTETTPVKTTIKPNSVTKTQTKVTTEVPKVYSDQNDRRSSQLPSTDKLSTDKLSTDNKETKEKKPILSMEDMKKTIGLDVTDKNNVAGLMPGAGLALKGLQKLASKLQSKGLNSLYDKGQALLGNSKSSQELLEGPGGKKLLEYAKRATDKAKESGGMKGEFRSQELRPDYKKGGKVKPFKQGGDVRTSSSKRGDGIAVKGYTRGKIC